MGWSPCTCRESATGSTATARNRTVRCSVMSGLRLFQTHEVRSEIVDVGVGVLRQEIDVGLKRIRHRDPRAVAVAQPRPRGAGCIANRHVAVGEAGQYARDGYAGR